MPTTTFPLMRESIPLFLPLEDEASYRTYPFDEDHPLADEPMVEASEHGLAADSAYDRRDGLNAPYYKRLDGALEGVWVRRSVANKLHSVNKRLEPLGVEVFVFDGFRRVECQRAIFDHFDEVIRRENPKANEENIARLLDQYISDPRGFDAAKPETWFSHCTGAAVDLTLRLKRTGEFLFMGSLFDDPSEISHTDFFERSGAPDYASAIDARRNRRLLYFAMAAEGFANLPTEWWHFDWGDKMWAKNRRYLDRSLAIEPAWYGPADDPEPS